MRVPGVRALHLEKTQNIAESRKILQYRVALVAVKDDQRHAPKTLPRNAPIRPLGNHVVDSLAAPGRRPNYLSDLRKRAPAQWWPLRRRHRRTAVIQLHKPLFGGAEDDRV